jgi:hypothetical protein
LLLNMLELTDTVPLIKVHCMMQFVIDKYNLRNIRLANSISRQINTSYLFAVFGDYGLISTCCNSIVFFKFDKLKKSVEMRCANQTCSLKILHEHTIDAELHHTIFDDLIV